MTDISVKRYGFDDRHIGTIRPSGNSLDARILVRPPGLSNADWWKHAADVTQVLEGQAKAIAKLEADNAQDLARECAISEAYAKTLERAEKAEVAYRKLDTMMQEVLVEKAEREMEAEGELADIKKQLSRSRFSEKKWAKACVEAIDAREKTENELAASQAALIPRPESEWHEDMGDVMWFHFPIQESPWVGTPLTSSWIEDWYTHFVPLPDFNLIHEAIAAQDEGKKADPSGHFDPDWDRQVRRAQSEYPAP